MTGQVYLLFFHGVLHQCGDAKMSHTAYMTADEIRLMSMFGLTVWNSFSFCLVMIEKSMFNSFNWCKNYEFFTSSQSNALVSFPLHTYQKGYACLNSISLRWEFSDMIFETFDILMLSIGSNNMNIKINDAFFFLIACELMTRSSQSSHL